VDQSGLIQSLPPSLPDGALKAYPDEAKAKVAVASGAIRAYYVIPQDYLQTGEVIYVRPDFNPLSAFEQAGKIKDVLQFNLLGGDASLVDKVDQPVRAQVKLLEPEQARDQNNPLAFFLPYAVTMMYYFVILMSSNLLLNSVTKEKENRVVEILLSTINPQQLLSGKIVGLGLAGLLQTIVWIGTGFSLLRLSGRSFNLPPDFQLPPSILVWGLVFFLLGYGVYASLMASVGALVPNLREASQATIVVVLPMIIPLILISVLIQEPNGALAIGLSLFPLTAPVAMMTRLAAGVVPVWQVGLSAGILLLTAVLIMRAVARMFRAQTLLSGQPFELRRLIAALAGRA
jgi:ABC-2 type transport system permease protein